jgi:PleD family two-component response regulator
MKKNIFNYAPPEIENKSILVVDDFGDMRNMLRSMLLSIGGQDIDLVARS